MTKKKDELLGVIPQHAKERMLKDKTKVTEAFYKGNKKEAYNRLQFARIYKGYDFLENFAFVKAYIMKKYEMDRIQLLEILLYLVPKNFFTLKDFADVRTLTYTYKKIDILVNKGYVAIASTGRAKSDHLYTCTAKARQIVQETYEMLSREIPIPEDNVLDTDIKTDKLKSKIIKELNKKTKPKTVALLWARKN